MASAIWPSSKISALSGDWIRIPAKQTLRAMVEASLRPLEDESNCPISSTYLSSCIRSRFTQRLDPELDTLLDSLASDELDILRTFAVDVNGLHHGLSSPTSKLVHGVSSWCLGRDRAIRNVALWYTDSIRDDITKVIKTFGQKCEDQDPRELFIRDHAEAYIAKRYANNIDSFLSQLEIDVAVIHLAHHVNYEMISKAMDNIRDKVEKVLDRTFGALRPVLQTNRPPLEPWKPGSEKLGSEKLGSEKLGSEKLGSEKLGSEKLGSEKLGSEKLGSEKKWPEETGSEEIGSEEIWEAGI